jgi:hypothetical protein
MRMEGRTRKIKEGADRYLSYVHIALPPVACHMWAVDKELAW